MQLSGLVTLEPTEGPVLANLADMAGDAFLEELWTQELLSALPETSRGSDRERFLSRAIILSDLAVGTPYQCGYCTPDGKGLLIGFRNSELAPQTWEALEEKGWKDLCKSVLSIEEQEALNKQLERMAPISVFDYPEKTHKHDDFIHLIMFAVAPDAQGTGVARKVLEPFFKLADEENLPIYLETYSDRLEGLYKHFGFEMVREYRSPEFAVYERVMVRKPGGER